MFVLGNFFQALAMVLGAVLDIYWWLILIRALLSWVNPDPYNSIVQFIERVTEPVLVPFRKLLPAYKLGMDLSPMIAALFIYFMKIFLVQTLLGLAVRFQ